MDRGYIWSPSLATNSLMRMADWSFPRREAVSMTTTSGCVELPDIAERREAPVAPVDTSVAVALVVSDHQHHRKTVSSLRGRRLGLAGHAAFETFWVLTRRPPPLRRTPRAVQQLLSDNFPESRFLGEAAARQLLGRLATLSIAGGAVYDALVGATAAAAGVRLTSRDRRALDTYRLLDLDFEILD